MKKLIYIVFFICIIACNTKKTISPGVVKTESPKNLKSNSKPNIYNCQLIEKEFVNKIGKGGGFKEFYLRCSVQDYFIKFCESNVTKKDLEPFLNKGISVEIEIRDGMWDSCSEGLEQVQSRMGSYIIIKKIN